MPHLPHFRLVCCSLLLSVLTPALLMARPAVSAGTFSALPGYFADAPAAAPLQSFKQSTETLSESLKVSGRLRELGRFTAVFPEKKNMHFTGGASEFIFLQGRARFRSGVILLATARIKQKDTGRYAVHLEFLDEGAGRYTLHRPFRLVQLGFAARTDGTTRLTRLRRGKKRPVGRNNCGTAHPLSAGLPAVFNQVTTSATLKQVAMIIEGDTALENQGKNLNSYLGTMMNMVDTWYKRDLGITYDTTIVSSAQSYSSSTGYDGSTYEYYLHDEMRSKRPAGSRSEYIHYLVTGKTDGDGLAGVVPDLATICRSKSDSIGFTIYYSDDETFNYETTAHEVGHLFAAEHDDASTGRTGYLMNSGTTEVDSYVSEFSQRSKNQVGSHVISYNSCLSGTEDDSGSGGDDSDDNWEDDSEVTIKFKNRKRRKRLIVKAWQGTRQNRLSYYQVVVTCGYSAENLSETIKTGTTNRRGAFKFRYRKRRTPGFCQAVIRDSNGQTIATSSVLSNVGRKQQPVEDDWDDNREDDWEYW